MSNKIPPVLRRKDKMFLYSDQENSILACFAFFALHVIDMYMIYQLGQSF